MAAIIYRWQQQQHVHGRTAQLSDISSGATCVADLDSGALALTKEASGNSRGKLPTYRNICEKIGSCKGQVQFSYHFTHFDIGCCNLPFQVVFGSFFGFGFG